MTKKELLEENSKLLEKIKNLENKKPITKCELLDFLNNSLSLSVNYDCFDKRLEVGLKIGEHFIVGSCHITLQDIEV